MEQVKRMKKYAVSGVYSHGGDLYKLLNAEKMQPLLMKIRKGSIDASKLIFGKDTITLEERFLENVNRYIAYIKDNFYFNGTEQNLTIEESLTNKYAKILLCKDNVHSGYHQYENIRKYTAGFIRMYLYNFYKNIFLFSKLYKDNLCTKRLENELSKFDFDDDEDILKIKKIFARIVNLRKNNIYNCFVSMKNIRKNQYYCYAFQLERCLIDYYSLNWSERYNYGPIDNYFITEDGSTILFNVLSKENSNYKIEFGVQNPYFSAKRDNLHMTVEELNNLINRFKKCYQTKKDNKESNEKIDFMNSAIKFDFWKDRANYELVEIEFHFNSSTEYYNVSLEREDIMRFIKLLENSTRLI